MPLTPHESTEHPITLYAASKKANELMAHTYSHLFGLPVTGVRFFTVYGPWGRPDMALFMFTNAILNNEPIKVFNNGEMVRDFTYVENIAEGLCRVLEKPAEADLKWTGKTHDPARSFSPYRIVNIGHSKPVNLMDYIKAIEGALGKKAVKEMLPIQPGDVPVTSADISDLANDYGYTPATEVEEGIKKYIAWHRTYYKI
jgi:UDP-glucuronate 4-epimerase